MKNLYRSLFTFMVILMPAIVFAQATTPKSIVDQGVKLNDEGKYAEAIVKYNEALKIDPNFDLAYYEMAYTLFSTGKGTEAIPYLEKLLKIDPKSGGAFDMLGSIYDDMKQPDKAMYYFNEGIKQDQGYQRLHFNLAISYYRQNKYPEAEAAALDAIKLDPKHAGSQRIYSMICFSEKKRGPSLLGWCSFLLLEPQTQRSVEAIKYVKAIIDYGVTKKSEKSVNISISPNETANVIMPLAVINATEHKKDLSAVDSLELQLTSLFTIANTMTGEKAEPAVTHYYADYFDKLGKSGNMPAFTRLITLSCYKEKNLKWFKDHPQELSKLDSWVKDTQRGF